MEKFTYYFTQLLIIVLAVQVIRIRAYRIVPWFSLYVWFAVMAGIARFLGSHSGGYSYFWSYWITETIYIFLGLAALYEVCRSVFDGLTHTRSFRAVIACILVVTILFAVLRAYRFPPNTSNHLIGVIVTSELVVRLLQGLMCGILVPTLIVFPQRWRQYPLGITIGFGLYAAVYLMATTYLSGFPNRFHSTWGHILISAYSVSVLIWLWFFRKPQSEDPENRDRLSLDEAIGELEKYERFLRRFRT